MGFLDDLAKLVEDPEVRRLAERRARSHELAEDALHETFRAVAQTQNPEAIRDLRAFFCKSLIHEINHQLARSVPVLTEDICAISDRRQDHTSSAGASPSASAESEAHVRLLAEAALTRLERDHARLMASVPARSDDPRRYRSTIIAAARTILRLLFEGHVTSADWNVVLKSEYPQWCDEPGLARDAIDQRLSRARGDVQSLLQAIFTRDELAPCGRQLAVCRAARPLRNGLSASCQADLVHTSRSPKEEEVTVTGLDNPAKPDHPDPEYLAVIGVAGWLREDRAAAEEYEEAMRADTHRHEMQRRMEATDRAHDDASVRVSGLIDKLNLDGRRMLAFWLGGAIVLALVMLDVIPLNWAAQAFGLNAAGSWVVTMILLAASVGAMVGLEAARHDSTTLYGTGRRHASRLCRSGGPAHVFPSHGGRRSCRCCTPASHRAQCDLRWPRLLRVRGDGSDAAAAAVPRSRGRPAGSPGLRSQRVGGAPGRGKAVPPPGRAAPAADQAAPVLRGATRGDPHRMGNSPGTRTSRPVRGAVSAPTDPHLIGSTAVKWGKLSL